MPDIGQVSRSPAYSAPTSETSTPTESGLSQIGGVPILVALFFLIYFVEHLDKSEHDGYYWLCIIMRTGATNIADYLAFGMHINAIRLSVLRPCSLRDMGSC
jgi:hypothetical protein